MDAFKSRSCLDGYCSFPKVFFYQTESARAQRASACTDFGRAGVCIWDLAHGWSTMFSLLM